MIFYVDKVNIVQQVNRKTPGLCAAVLVRIQEVLGSNLGLETGFSD